MKTRYTLYIIVVVALCLTLSGCTGSIFSNYREISTLQPVQTLGYDFAGGDYTATISTGEGLEEQPAVLISRKGKTIADCFESIENYSAKNELYFDQTRYLLLGESAALDSLTPYFDYIQRSGVPRLDNSLFVVKGGSARELIKGSGDKLYDVTECLATIERDAQRRGKGAAFNCREALRSLYEFGSALICAVKISPLEGSVFSEGDEVTAVPAGFAIISGDKLVGYIELDDCALGANLLLNKSGSGPVTVYAGDKGNASLSINSAKTQFDAEWRDGKLLSVTAKVELSARLVALTGSAGVQSVSQLELIAQSLENETKTRCENVLELCRELKCDFLGIAAQLRQAKPTEYSKLREAFPEALAGAEIKIEVTAQLDQTYVREEAGRLWNEAKK